ncbi:MAG: DUF6886 family protein [Caulobacteraceae bacterium]
MRLFHFSDDPTIARFEPRAVRVPSSRGPGMEWLNGPLVWAIEEGRAAMYLFPRDCPRILLWPTEATTADDRRRWWGERTCAAIAHIEWAWFDRLVAGEIHRYELPVGGFERLGESLGGPGMWIAREPAEPLAMETIADLPAALAAAGVELRVMETLAALKGVWETSLHASGVRLRNARGWGG